MSVEPCLKARCYSPMACGSWGYCRERNLPTDEMDERGVRPKSLIEERRAIAAATRTDPALEAMAKALDECQKTLAMLTDTACIETSTVIYAWSHCVSAELHARQALALYRNREGNGNG